MSDVATSKRLGRDRYLFSLNWCSNSSSCWLVKAVLGLLHLPSRLDCAWAADATTGTGKHKHHLQIKHHNTDAFFFDVCARAPDVRMDISIEQLFAAPS